jgi:hypothetical protein
MILMGPRWNAKEAHFSIIIPLIPIFLSLASAMCLLYRQVH